MKKIKGLIVLFFILIFLQFILWVQSPSEVIVSFLKYYSCSIYLFCIVLLLVVKDVDSLLYKREALRCSGKIYSEEHRRKFDVKNDIFRVEKNPTDSNKLVLAINRQPISEWFREQWEKLRRGLRQTVEEPRKSRGIKL